MNSEEFYIYCPEHKELLTSLATDDKIDKFFCEKCKSDESIKTENINDFIKNFYNCKKIFNYKKINFLLSQMKNIDLNDLQLKVEKYLAFNYEVLDKKIDQIRSMITEKLDNFKKQIRNDLIDLRNSLEQADMKVDVGNVEIPENFTLDETQKFFEKNLESIKDLENMINLIKKYSDSEKLKANMNEMETIIYCKNLTEKMDTDALVRKIKDMQESFNKEVIEQLDLLKKQPPTKGLIYDINDYFGDHPLNFELKQTITTKCQKSYTIDCVFCAFISLEGSPIVAWGNSSHQLEIFDLYQNKVIHTLTGHKQHIYIVRHFVDTNKNIDYLITTSYEKSVKVWDLKQAKCILTIPNCHKSYYVYSALMTFLEGETNVVTSAPNEKIKVWNMEGVCVREIGTTSDYIYYINVWINPNTGKTCLINANSVDVKFYNFYDGALIKQFKSKSSSSWHMSALIIYWKNDYHLVDSDGNGNLRVWNIESGEEVKTINTPGCNLRGLCLWNDQYIICASSDKSYKVYDLNSMQLVETKTGHENVACTVSKILHPIYGECILSSAIDGAIKLWGKK
jgi:WD40 repeat protein